MEPQGPTPYDDLFFEAARRVFNGDIQADRPPKTSPIHEVVWFKPKVFAEGFSPTLLRNDQRAETDRAWYSIEEDALRELAPEIEVPDWVADHGEHLSAVWRTYQAAARIFPRHEVLHPEQGPVYLELLCQLAADTRYEVLDLYDQDVICQADARELLDSVDWQLYEDVPQVSSPGVDQFGEIASLGQQAERFVAIHALLAALGAVPRPFTREQEARWSQTLEYHQNRVILWARDRHDLNTEQSEIYTLLSSCDISPDVLNDYGSY